MLEAVFVLALIGAGFLAFGHFLTAAATAARDQRAKTQAIDSNEAVTARLTEELTQAAEGAGNGGIVVLDSGRTVQFRRVVGARMIDGAMVPEWSEPISIAWNGSARTMTRQVGDETPAILAKGIQNFHATLHPNGSIQIDLEVRRKSLRGEEMAHSNRIRVMPRNSTG